MTDNEAVQLSSLLVGARYDEAERLAQSLLAQGRIQDLAHFTLGIVHYQRRDYDGAVEALQRAITLNLSLIHISKLPLSKTGGNLADDQDGTQTEW